MEEKEFVDENIMSAAAAAHADISHDSLQDNPGTLHHFSMPDLVEIDSDSDMRMMMMVLMARKWQECSSVTDHQLQLQGMRHMYHIHQFTLGSLQLKLRGPSNVHFGYQFLLGSFQKPMVMQ